MVDLWDWGDLWEGGRGGREGEKERRWLMMKTT